MTPIAKLYALLESNGIYDEAISLLKEHRDNRNNDLNDLSDWSDDNKPKTHVIGPDGSPITVSDLPSDVNVRWSPLLKAKLATLVMGGLFSFDDAFNRYNISSEELNGWIRKYGQHGHKGLSSMKTQQYR